MDNLTQAIADFIAGQGGYKKLAAQYGVAEADLRDGVTRARAEARPAKKSPAKGKKKSAPVRRKPEPPPPEPIPEHEPAPIAAIRRQLVSLQADMAETRDLMDLALSARPAAMTAASNMRKELNRLAETERTLLNDLVAAQTQHARDANTDHEKRARILDVELPALVRYAPAFAEAMRRTLDGLLGPRLELVHDADAEVSR